MAASSSNDECSGAAVELDTSAGRDPKDSYYSLIRDKIAELLSESVALRQQGKPSQSVARINRAIFLQSNNPDLFRERAEAFFSLRDYHNAIINLERVLVLTDTDKEDVTGRIGCFHFHYALKLLQDKKHEEALEMMRLAEAKGFDSDRIVGKKVKCLVALKRYTECLAVIEDELQRSPSNVDLIIARAQLNVLFGDVAKGYWDVCKALELQEDHTEAMEMKRDLEKRATVCRDRAVHQTLAGKSRDALHKITLAIDTNPSVPDYHILRGTLHRKSQNFTAAVDDYLKAMDKCGHGQDLPVYRHASRQLVLTYNDFALSCFKKRKFDSAILLLNKAIKEEKGEKGLYLNRGDCFYRTNKLRFALSDYKQALELDPAQWDIYCRVAVVCSEIGVELFGQRKFEEAEDLFTAAVHHNPKVARFYLCRSRARLERKNVKGAREDVVSSLTLDPRSDECIPVIARIFPGKSKEDILWLHPASNEIRSNMKNLRTKMASPRAVKSPDKDVRPYSPLHMFKLELRMGEEDGLPSEEEGRDRRNKKDDIETQLQSVGSESSEMAGSVGLGNELLPGSSSRLSQQGVRFQGASPRVGRGISTPTRPGTYSATAQPSLPRLVSSNRRERRRVMPELQECLQEAHFHRTIYYSKKFSTDELRRVLEALPGEAGQYTTSKSKSAEPRARHRTF